MSQLSLIPKQEVKQNKKIVRIGKFPVWFDKAVASSLAGISVYSFNFSSSERKVFLKRKPILVSEWAERHRVLEMSSIPGRWKNIFSPYLTGIMDAAGTNGIETVIICKTPQCGGSEASHNIVGYCVDRAPGPVMYVFPDEITARENAKDRIIPMIKASARLREYLTTYENDLSSLRINFLHMPIYLGWSGSVSRLGNKPIRTLILDELDKYKDPKNEATSEALAEKRTTTWGSRKKIIKISTPTKAGSSKIWKALTEEAEARFDYYVKCPDCGFIQLMRFENITWEGKKPIIENKDENIYERAAAEKILSHKLAYYTCEFCGTLWSDEKRDIAVRHGEWRERNSGLELFSHINLYKPLKVGFQIPAWISRFVSLSEIVSAWFKYKISNSMEDYKDFKNQYCAEVWEEIFEERSEDTILALCDDRPRGMVPGFDLERKSPRVAVLLATVDTQLHYFRYVIRAWGYGENAETWLIQEGIAQNTDQLDKILWQSDYIDNENHVYKVRTCLIDAMGNPEKSCDVINWALRNRQRVLLSQGVHSPANPVSYTPWEFFPSSTGTKIKIPGGILLHRIDTTLFKGMLAHALKVNPADPGAFHLHENTKLQPNSSKGILEGYAKEMCAEVWNEEKHLWENPRKRPNHAFDCEYMQFALAWILNVKNIPRPDEEQFHQTEPPMPVPAKRTNGATNILAKIRR